ncbi:MAG: TIGR02186 family protein [Desulfotomaculales bacterium]
MNPLPPSITSRRMAQRLVPVAVLAFALALLVCGQAALGLQTGPPRVDAAVRFFGATVDFWGEVEPGSQVVVKATAPAADVFVAQESRAAGFLGSGRVVVRLPALHEVLTSCELAAIPPEVRRQIGIEWRDSEAVREAAVSRVDMGRTLPVDPALREEYLLRAVRWQERNGNYRLGETGLVLDNGRFRGTLHIGPYGPRRQVTLTAYAIREGRVAEVCSTTVDLPAVLFTRPFGQEAGGGRVADRHGGLCRPGGGTAGTGDAAAGGPAVAPALKWRHVYIVTKLELRPGVLTGKREICYPQSDGKHLKAKDKKRGRMEEP